MSFSCARHLSHDLSDSGCQMLPGEFSDGVCKIGRPGTIRRFRVVDSLEVWDDDQDEENLSHLE